MILVMIVCACQITQAQSLPDMEAIMRFSGSDDPMELNPEEVEFLEYLLYHPLRLNNASESELQSCGLFTSYQVASICDYVSNHGPVRSLVELALLDGFGNDFVYKIAPFVELGDGVLSPSTGRGVKYDIVTKGGLIWRESDEYDGSYGIKSRVDSPGRFTASLAASRASGTSSWKPSAWSGSFVWRFRRIPLRLTAGDFYARFGQGLVLWSSSLINSLSSPDMFMKRPSGITQPWSFTGGSSMRGIAVDYGTRHWKFSLLADMKDMKTAVNAAWYGHDGQVSLTNLVALPGKMGNNEMQVVSGLDASFCFRGINLFGEIAYAWHSKSTNVLAGTRFRVGEPLDFALHVRSLQNEESGAALSGAFKFGRKLPSSGTLSVDFVYYPISKEEGEPYSMQVKSLLQWELCPADNWKVRFRLSERIRTWGLPFRTDVRSDIIYSPLPFVVGMRVNLLSCDKTGFLSYLEGGYDDEKISVYLRQGAFFIDDWDDRIYVYERDAPSSFNVPAMYGRGVWSALTASWNVASCLKLYVRTSFIGYPFMEKKKPGKAELKLQLQYRF